MAMILDVCAIIGAILGAIIVASNLGYNWIGYILFLISTIASILILKRANGNVTLIWIQWFYLTVNLFGIYRYVTI